MPAYKISTDWKTNGITNVLTFQETNITEHNHTLCTQTKPDNKLCTLGDS